MPEPALVVVARAPERGRVKTRLARDLGADHALSVYHQLLQRTAAAAASWSGPVLLATTGDQSLFSGTGLERHPRCEQPAGGLGRRLSAALRAGCELADAAIVIGTDCPGLTTGHLRQVAAGVRQADASFGPATDGGFWSLGSGCGKVIDLLSHPDLPWSAPNTLDAFRKVLEQHGLSSCLGPSLDDLDVIDDLRSAIRSGLLSPVDSGLTST